MIYKTYSADTERLLQLPETGMGYQLIEAITSSNKEYREFVVFNAELIIERNDQYNVNRRKLITEGLLELKTDAPFLFLKSIKLKGRLSLTTPRMLTENKLSENGRTSGGNGAIDSSIVYPDGEQEFVRLSAYENDKRIDFENNCLLKGTYTTTLLDYYSCRNNNDDPVDRYALPNSESIKWAFYVKPKTYDGYRFGVVQPANNKQGGGLEALFENGTSYGTFYRKSKY